MLPKGARIRSSKEFRQTVRRGVRVGRPTLVVHAGVSRSSEEVRVGFVVSRAVGNAVTRNRVKRRLRHLARAGLPLTPPGTNIVVRALPRATTEPGEVAKDFQTAWARAIGRLAVPGDHSAQRVKS